MIIHIKCLMYLGLLPFILFIVSCSKAPETQTIQLVLHNNASAVQCQNAITINNKQWNIEQFLFYLHDIEYQDLQGNWHKLLLSTNAYQYENIVLLGETCENETLKNWQIELAEKMPLTHLSALRFNIGVPFEQNHLNPIGQASPLSLPSMFWVWRSGHKFMRLEFSTNDNFWLFHLGSTGCHSQSAVRAPSSPCVNPNIVEMHIPMNNTNNEPLISEKSQSNLQIEIAFEQLIDALEISNKTQCQSEPDNLACQLLINNLHKKDVFKIGNHHHEI